MADKPKIPREPRDDEEVVYTTRITLRNGVVKHASECGKKVFRFIVKKNPDRQK